MKLDVCYGTWTAGKPVHNHPCGEAHKALVEADYEAEACAWAQIHPASAATVPVAA